jgi:transposase-like protein
MYTTNIIEGFHRQLRAVTKTKGAFQSEEAPDEAVVPGAGKHHCQME